jgi:hypothetical protein
LLDDCTFWRVTDPPATAVYIVSAQGSSTRGWASEESGFNRNDTAGYTYELVFYPPATTAGITGAGITGDGLRERQKARLRGPRDDRDIIDIFTMIFGSLDR